MSERLVFEKWEGLGNDFVIVAVAEPIDLDTATVRALCDRRRGIGADGVLLVERRPGGPPRMIVRNADGSRPEMCGNGLRCVAGWLEPQGGELTIQTDAGPRQCLVERNGSGYQVTVGMGAALFGEPLTVAIDGALHQFATVDVGNPHAVTFEPYDDAAIDRIGPIGSCAPPHGHNVEFAKASGSGPRLDRIDVVVWERGVGRTLACGTGACAVAAAACRQGRATWGEPLVIGLPGGDLAIVVERDARAITMRGPARRAFVGEVELP